MHGLTVGNTKLDLVLAPIAQALDKCWWHINGAGMRFPQVRQPRRLPAEKPVRPRRGPGRHTAADVLGPYDPADYQRYTDEMSTTRREFEGWFFQGFAMPGFFSRYAEGVCGDWQVCFASDAEDLPLSLHEAASRFGRVWFAPPPDDLPSDICLITRDVDYAYLDLFFRDRWMFDSVWNDLDAKGMNPKPYRPLEFEDPHGKRRR